MSENRSDLLTRMRGSVLRGSMFAPGQKLVVGVSGGPDSAALLHALAALREEWQLTLVACHVNHGFRGAESDGDAAYVRGLCERLDVACHVEFVDVPAMRKRRHLSAQQAARSARHAILRRVMADVGAERIALAHTRDDRAESVLLNAVRGSGLEGLGGFAPVALPLVRPFYDVSRAQVERYCEAYALHPRQDSSNLKTDYRRNRVRLDLLPYLREHFNPRTDDALLRLADLARDDSALLDRMALDALAQMIAASTPQAFASSNGVHAGSAHSLETLSAALQGADSLILERGALNAQPLALRRRTLRLAIALLRGHLQDVRFEAVESLLSALEQGRSQSIELPAAETGIFRVFCDGKWVTVRKADAPQSGLAWQTLLETPARTFVPQAGVTITAAFYTPKQLAAYCNAWLSAGSHVRSALFAWNRADVEMPLLVRSWQAGDGMRPLGLNGTKKLQDIFVDEKLPASLRSRVPVLVDADGIGRILAAGGLRADETALLAARFPHDQTGPTRTAERLRQIETRYQELLAVAFEYE